MKKRTIPTPRIRDITRGTAMLFPDGYEVPWTVLVRTAVHETTPRERNDGFQIEFPGAGLVTFPGGGRKFSFMPTEAYADRKGYARGKAIEGDW